MRSAFLVFLCKAPGTVKSMNRSPHHYSQPSIFCKPEARLRSKPEQLSRVLLSKPSATDSSSAIGAPWMTLSTCSRSGGTGKGFPPSCRGQPCLHHPWQSTHRQTLHCHSSQNREHWQLQTTWWWGLEGKISRKPSRTKANMAKRM